jgi:hypothetical protein
MNGISRTRYDFAEFLLSLLGDVEITDPITDNSILQYNATTGKWENVTQQDSGFLVNFEDDTTTGDLTAKKFWTSTLFGGTAASQASIGYDADLGIWVGDFAASEKVGIDANGENVALFRRSDAGVNDIRLEGSTKIDHRQS